jgi:hypothetical protein
MDARVEATELVRIVVREWNPEDMPRVQWIRSRVLHYLTDSDRAALEMSTQRARNGVTLDAVDFLARQHKRRMQLKVAHLIQEVKRKCAKIFKQGGIA